MKKILLFAIFLINACDTQSPYRWVGEINGISDLRCVSTGELEDLKKISHRYGCSNWSLDRGFYKKARCENQKKYFSEFFIDEDCK